MKIRPRIGVRSPVLRRPIRSLLALGPALVLALGACNLFESDLNPGEIQVVLESPSGGDMVVVLSDDFVVEGVDEDSDLTVVFITSDTVVTGAPFDRTYPLAPRYRFFVKVEPRDSTAPPRPLNMQVLVDGDVRYDKDGSLGEEDFEFLYSFN